MKKILAAMLAALMILLGACALAEEEKLAVTVNGVAVTGTIEVDLSRTNTLKLEANMPVAKWRRSSSSRCDIAQDGTLTIKKTGSFTITVTAENGQKTVVKFKVVKKATSINITGSTHELAAGKKLYLKASVLPSGVSNKKVTWASSNPSAATVSSSGRVTAQKVSARTNVTITATAKDGSGVVGTYNLTITPLATSVKLYLNGELVNGQTMYVDVNSTSALTLTTVVEPADASQAVTWKTSSRSYATVAGGVVSIKKRGNVTITAVAADGSRVSARVIFKIAAISKSVTISGVETLPAGKTATLKAEVLPKNTTNRKVSWWSSDPSVLSINSSTGRMKAGTVTQATAVTITAMAADGGSATSRKVIVTPRAISVNVKQNGSAISNVVFVDSGTMSAIKLNASVYPADAAQNVTWKSGNTRVVRVDQNGVLTPVKKGKTTVTVTANDGTGVKRTFYVAVGDFSQMPYYIEVDKANQVIRVYERGDGTYTHLIRRMVCSTGVRENFTNGLYEMNGQRYKWCLAADGHLYMQYATRIKGSYMFHGVPTDGVGGSRVKAAYYAKLGKKASGGCIRMLCADAKWIYENVPNGAYVLVMAGTRNPSEYGAVTIPKTNQTTSLIWDPTDDNPANPYYDAEYTSEVN